jgi:phosphatidylinositol alpha-1,6-mannosyltransferase
MKILFISRTYPPVQGGMEKVSYHLIKAVAALKKTKVDALVNTRGKANLIPFLMSVVPKVIFKARKYQVVHLSDAVLAPVGEIIKLIHPKVKVVVTIHGLDITYGEKNEFYKKINLSALNSLDKIIAVSNNTKKEAKKYVKKKEKIIFVPNGITKNEYYDSCLGKKHLINFLSHKKNDPDLVEKKFLLTLGRLQKRKGIVWFLNKVMPKLSKNVIYLIAGGGPQKERIQQVIKKKNLNKRVKMLGAVAEDQKKLLFNTVDLFIQPNIKVKGDAEGFGVTMLEAASCQTPVVASGIEGIKDAITQDKNGFLVESKNEKAYLEQINRLLKDDKLREDFGQSARKYTVKNYNWAKIAKKYYQIFKKL